MELKDYIVVVTSVLTLLGNIVVFFLTHAFSIRKHVNEKVWSMKLELYQLIAENMYKLSDKADEIVLHLEAYGGNKTRRPKLTGLINEIDVLAAEQMKLVSKNMLVMSHPVRVETFAAVKLFDTWDDRWEDDEPMNVGEMVRFHRTVSLGCADGAGKIVDYALRELYMDRRPTIFRALLSPKRYRRAAEVRRLFDEKAAKP